MATAHRSVLGWMLSLALVAGAGCGREGAERVVAPTAGVLHEARIGGEPGLLDGALTPASVLAMRNGKLAHPYYPIVPGAYSDYRVNRLGVGLRYVRVTAGNPEPFFTFTATPFVYDDVPGQTRDSTLYGLRQYYSISPDGDLWFHGAQNNGFMSHTTPPVRMLRAKPKPGDAWIDSVLFESFLPGGILFFQNDESYAWTISDPARLVLPGGTFRAIRSSSVIDDLPPGTAGSGPMHTAAMLSLGDGAWEAFARRGLAALPEPLKGTWFSRHDGMVARDWPSGQGEVNLNAVTFELIAQGMGPVPPPTPPPVPPGTE